MRGKHRFGSVCYLFQNMQYQETLVIHSFMMKLKLISGIIAVLAVTFSAFLIIVDGVAIIFTYISLIFAAFSISASNIRILKIYGVIFVASHIVLVWRINSDMHQGYQGQPPVSVSVKQFEVM